MWSLTSPRADRIGGPKKLCSSARKDFNTICQARTSPTERSGGLLPLGVGANILRRHQPGIVAQCPKFATEMMRADAGFHADQARRHIGKAGLDLATRPFLTQHNRATLIVAHDVERVLADIDTNHGKCSVQCLGHGVLLVLTPLPSFYCWRGGSTAR